MKTCAAWIGNGQDHACTRKAVQGGIYCAQHVATMKRRAALAAKPVGLTYDLLVEIRKAMRTLRRAEQWIVREHRAEKRRRQSKSDEWEQSRRIRDEERAKS